MPTPADTIMAIPSNPKTHRAAASNFGKVRQRSLHIIQNLYLQCNIHLQLDQCQTMCSHLCKMESVTAFRCLNHIFKMTLLYHAYPKRCYKNVLECISNCNNTVAALLQGKQMHTTGRLKMDFILLEIHNSKYLVKPHIKATS